MNTLKSKKHIWVGMGLLLTITLALGWFVGRYIPGTPQSLQPNTTWASYPLGNLTCIPISKTVYIRAGESKQIDGMTRGDKFTPIDVGVRESSNWETKEETIEVIEEERKVDPEAEGYLVEYPSFELTVTDAKTVTFNAFGQWYPDFRFTPSKPANTKPAGTFVLVDIAVTNLSNTQVLNLEDIQLWSEGLVQMHPGYLGNGYGISLPALSCLEGLPRYEAGEYRDPTHLTTFEPGETRSLTIPYEIYRNAFVDGSDFDSLDLSRFCLEVYDYDPGTIYQFGLVS